MHNFLHVSHWLYLQLCYIGLAPATLLTQYLYRPLENSIQSTTTHDLDIASAMYFPLSYRKAFTYNNGSKVYLWSMLSLNSFRTKLLRLAQPGTDALRVKGRWLRRPSLRCGCFKCSGILRFRSSDDCITKHKCKNMLVLMHKNFKFWMWIWKTSS